jgi:anti-sigma factor RsiW
MNCLRIDQIYLYLEGELPPEEYPLIESHIFSCEKCRKAVQERKRLVDASRSLPAWEVPQDFAQRIIETLFPKKISFRDWVITSSIGLSSAVLAFFAVYLLSGQTIAALFINLNRTALNLFKNIVLIAVKAAKLLSAGIHVILKILSVVINGLRSLTTVLGPEFQIGLIVLTVIITALLLFGAKRKLFAGEKA